MFAGLSAFPLTPMDECGIDARLGGEPTKLDPDAGGRP